jgi:hypothetical protein
MQAMRQALALHFFCMLHFYILQTTVITFGIIPMSRSTISQIFHPMAGNV